MEEFLRFDLSLLKETSYRLTCFLLNYFIHYKTYFSWEIITLGPNEEIKVRVNGHSESLDAIIHVRVTLVTTDGKICAR